MRTHKRTLNLYWLSSFLHHVWCCAVQAAHVRRKLLAYKREISLMTGFILVLCQKVVCAGRTHIQQLSCMYVCSKFLACTCAASLLYVRMQQVFCMQAGDLMIGLIFVWCLTVVCAGCKRIQSRWRAGLQESFTPTQKISRTSRRLDFGLCGIFHFSRPRRNSTGCASPIQSKNSSALKGNAVSCFSVVVSHLALSFSEFFNRWVHWGPRDDVWRSVRDRWMKNCDKKVLMLVSVPTLSISNNDFRLFLHSSFFVIPDGPTFCVFQPVIIWVLNSQRMGNRISFSFWAFVWQIIQPWSYKKRFAILFLICLVFGGHRRKCSVSIADDCL